jgi:hypothetical protein
MSDVKYFVNRREPEAAQLAQQMRDAGIVFSIMPTSGPLTIWVNGKAYQGPTAVKLTVQRLVEASGKPEHLIG